MHRFYIPPARWNPEAPALDAAETHHALDVVRLQPGARAVVFNGEGEEVTVEVASVGKRELTLRPLHRAQSAPLPARITLAQAIPKGKNMDLIVQKATELGAAEVVPLLSERTIIRLDPAEAARKQEKWQAIAIEAAKQCGQNWLPTVAAPQTPKAFLESAAGYEVVLIASLQPGARHPKAVLAEAEATLGRRPTSALVLVGPEGDFTPAEISLALGNGCLPITLGPIILRTETAALYCLSVLGYELLAS